MKYYIEEQAWEAILSFFQKKKAIHNKNEEKIRQFIEAIWFIVRTGCQWRLLPDYYDCWYSITIKRGTTETMTTYNYLVSNNNYSSHQGSLKLSF